MPEDTFSNAGVGTTTGNGGTPAATTDPAQKLDSGKTHAVQAAQDLRAAAEAKAAQARAAAETKAGELRERATQTYGDVRDRAQNLRTDSEQYIRDNPTRAVMTALGLGFVLGLIFRR